MIQIAELTTVTSDTVVVCIVPDNPDHECTTRVGEHEVTTIGAVQMATITGLEPGADYELRVTGVDHGPFLPETVRTLDPLGQTPTAVVATTNDVHFGETECGRWDTDPAVGPIFQVAPDAEPYPITMNRAAIAEIAACDPDVVLVKGDLTDRGTPEEYATFLEEYGRLGARLHHVRGNHDAMIDPDLVHERAPYSIALNGVVLAMLDTTRPGDDQGELLGDQLDWLDALAHDSADPVLVFGHHHPWDPADPERNPDYFGINPDDSERLVALIARRPAVHGYFAGHTHRNRVRRFSAVPQVPIVEVSCTKDYPGVWAEYRIDGAGYAQIVRRISSPAALAWTEQTREMFFGLYRDYALGAIEHRCFTQRFVRG